MADAATAMAPPTDQVPMSTRLGPVRIAVTEPNRALAVWRDLVGLEVLSESPGEIRLGVGSKPLIVLEPGAKHVPARRSLGLYHVAIHVPARRDLALIIARLAAHRFRNSPTDHLATETTYLWDLDGNGIEITFETPWRGELATDGVEYFGIDPEGKRHPGVAPLDLKSLMAELGDNPDIDARLPAGTRIGHVHVHVADLNEAMHFYSDVLGFPPRMMAAGVGLGDVGVDYPPHILAFNSWAGPDAKQPPPGSVGLRHFTIDMPDAASQGEMKKRLAKAGAPLKDIEGGFETADPSGNRMRVRVKA